MSLHKRKICTYNICMVISKLCAILLSPAPFCLCDSQIIIYRTTMTMKMIKKMRFEGRRKNGRRNTTMEWRSANRPIIRLFSLHHSDKITKINHHIFHQIKCSNISISHMHAKTHTFQQRDTHTYTHHDEEIKLYVVIINRMSVCLSWRGWHPNITIPELRTRLWPVGSTI